MRIYLDYNATAPLAAEAAAAMVAAMAQPGNPSSIHGEGRAARQVVETSRRRVAALLGGAPDEVVFTGGGTEADVLGAVGLARLARARGAPARVLSCPTVHPALHGALAQLALEGFVTEWLPVDALGRLAPFSAGGAALVVVSAANHETGVVQDLAGLRAWSAGALLLVDAVQWAGKRELGPVTSHADAVAISAHKIGGPKGVGALWVKPGLAIGPLVAGGHQERERRPGTENVAGIAGFGAAAQGVIDGADAAARVAALAQAFELGVQDIPGARITGHPTERIGNTVNVRFDGARGDAIAMALDVAGIAVSNGAACTSGSPKPSPVLLAMGLSTQAARSAVRFSFGAGNTQSEVARVLEVLPAIVERARRFS